jgi:hypothetical protein
MKQPKTHQEKIEWYSVLHKQNLNGRETEDELFELGISAGIEETEELQDEFAIGFNDWVNVNGYKYPTKITTKELLEIYKKENQL